MIEPLNIDFENVTPPSHFKRYISEVRWAEPLFDSWWLAPKPSKNAAKRRGQLFERKISNTLCREFPAALPQLPFRFYTRKAPQIAIPDVLIFSNKAILIVEIKYNHSSDAWHQLHHLYVPVVKKVFPTFDIKVLEICSWYDVAVKLKQPKFVFTCMDTIKDLLYADAMKGKYPILAVGGT